MRRFGRFGRFGAHPRVNALNAIGDLRLQQAMADDATILSADAFALARVVGDRVGEAHALIQLGMSARMLGEVDHARPLREKALSLARNLGDSFVAWRSLLRSGVDAGFHSHRRNRRQPPRPHAPTVAGFGVVNLTGRARECLLVLAHCPPLCKSRLEILAGPESQQPPNYQPCELQVVHAISQVTTVGGRGWVALYRSACGELRAPQLSVG